jgi:hypothetical protein
VFSGAPDGRDMVVKCVGALAHGDAVADVRDRRGELLRGCAVYGEAVTPRVAAQLGA